MKVLLQCEKKTNHQLHIRLYNVQISDVSDDKHKHELVIQAHPSFVFSSVGIKAKRKWSFGISCNLEHSKQTISIVFEAIAELINLG